MKKTISVLATLLLLLTLSLPALANSKEPITLRVLIGVSSNKVDPSQMPFFIKLQEDLNVKLEFEVLTQNAAERISIIFASGEFPDIMFKGPTETQILDAAESGQILPLNDLIEQYSPTWKALLEKDDYVRKVATSSDGNIWSLPIVRQEAVNSGIRDIWLINKKWLQELNLAMPTTVEEFYQVLKAFKDNAGKGSIPENAVPWAARFEQYANGGIYELFSSFGVFTPGSPSYFSVDEKGKVVFSAVDPGMKKVLAYLHKLYAEGLIAPEMFTDNLAAYDSKVLAVPAMVGVAMKYYGWDLEENVWTAMAPLYGPNGEIPMYRQQTNSVQRNSFTVFKNNVNIEKTMEIAEYIAQPDNSLQALYGPIGSHLSKVENGFQQEVLTSEMLSVVPDVGLPIVITPAVLSDFEYAGLAQQRNRYIKEVYAPFIAPLERFYPPVVFTAEQTASIQDIQTDLTSYISETFAHWIVDGNIEAGWDAFVQRAESLRLKELITIYQDALDNFNKG